MAIRWRVTIDVTDIKGKYDQSRLFDEIMSQWLPPSHDIKLEKLNVEKVEMKVKAS